MATERYVPNLASLDRGFPPALPTPELLRTFAIWLAEQARSSLGWFHLESEPLPPALVADDDALAALRAELGLFLRLPSGARLALWTRAGASPAVVRIGSRTDLGEVAPDLETFLIALSRAATGIPELDRNPDDPTRARLAQWLAGRGVRASGAELAAGSFGRWFEATATAARSGATASQPTAASLPTDLFAQVDPLIGRLVDERPVARFFEGIGLPLEPIRNPDRLRFLARPSEGVVFSIAWPWELPSEWLEREFPVERRAELEQRRARMLWSVELIVAPERRTLPRSGEVHELAAYRGALPFGIAAGDDIERLEAKLGAPIVGRYGYRMWDYPEQRRSLTLGLNEGPVLRPELPHGALTWLRWHRRQSV